jgi:hypothetical protein
VLIAGSTGWAQQDASQEEERFVVCDDTEVIELESCRDLAPDEDPGSGLVFRVQGLCIGAPGLEEAPRCTTVRVEESNHLPIQGARLELRWNQGETTRALLIQQSDPGGALQVPAWPDRLLLTAPGLEVLEVSFLPLLQLHGRITLNGQPLAGQTVSVISQGGDHTFEAVQLISDADGRYSVAVPGPGTWRFRHRGASADADVLGPCPCLVDINLARNNEQ